VQGADELSAEERERLAKLLEKDRPMIDFWLSAGLLLLAALSFLLIPILRGRRRQQEEDRTA
jgi:hypothetical protein